MAAAEDSLRSALDASLSETTAPVVLAVSGGRDSMALLHASARWYRHRVAAVATFDHGTGAYATDAAALVVAEARRLGLTVVRERAQQPLHNEAAWRTARWRFLDRVARAYRAQVSTAHTLDDQLETIVMRALRGAGARGLAALAAPSPIVRPWLTVSRSDVADWVASQSLAYLDDPMNSDQRFQRSRVRHELLPALERASPGFGASMLALGARAAAWRREVEGWVDDAILLNDQRVLSPERVVRVRWSLFEHADDVRAMFWPAVCARVGGVLDARGTRTLTAFTRTFRPGRAAQVAGGVVVLATTTDVGEAALEVRSVCADGRGVGYRWQGAAEAIPLRLGRWRFQRLAPIAAREASATRQAGAVFGVPLDVQITVRNWCAGDRIVTRNDPAGRRVARYFSEQHIAPLDRTDWPVVLVGSEVLAVPGVCQTPTAPNRPGWPDSIWYRCDRTLD